jgi:phage shock protein PspC (stress-responsive transcriptional regulator)
MVRRAAHPYGAVMDETTNAPDPHTHGVGGDAVGDSPAGSTGADPLPGSSDDQRRFALRRSRDHRVIAGVARGIADRYDIDPLIVRIAFVILACLWLFGVALYLIVWAVVPYDVPTHESARRRVDPRSLASAKWLPVALLAATAVAVLVVLTTLGGRPDTSRNLGLLWLVFLAVLAIVAIRTRARPMTLRRLAGFAYLTLLSLLILVVGTAAAVLASIGVPEQGGNGVRTWQPTSLAQVRASYRTDLGQETVDLSGVVFPASGRSVIASVAVGHLVVVVPADAIVNLESHVGIGSVNYSGAWPDPYPWIYRAVPSTLRTATERAGAPHVTIDASVGIGTIQIQRAYVPAR